MLLLHSQSRPSLRHFGLSPERGFEVLGSLVQLGNIWLGKVTTGDQAKSVTYFSVCLRRVVFVCSSAFLSVQLIIR